ncbi:MAG: hypothetical protein FWG55_00965, partial [Candidatus Bathyarchaeota archaeon]|nr:hypothetical protein [Candidatus Termiticorpusculum sp.]
FPNGVPAVSDASMSEWMLYVYKQFEQPMDTTGVTVVIDAINPAGDYEQLGTATSDASGMFMFKFAPSMEGEYIIYAYFEGSESYYGSGAQTGITVMAATETVADNNTPFGLYTIAIIAAVILVGVFLGLLVIKKK